MHRSFVDCGRAKGCSATAAVPLEIFSGRYLHIRRVIFRVAARESDLIMKKLLNSPRNAVLIAAVILISTTAPRLLAETGTNAWDKSAALGLTLTKGNSDTLLFTGNILATEKKEGHEIDLGADAAYGENNHVKNNETAHAFGQFNHLFTPRTYVYGRVDGLHDGIAGIKYRITVSPGAGYYWVKTKETSFSTEAGPSMIYEKLAGHRPVVVGTNTVLIPSYTTSTYFTLRLADKFEYKL